MAEQELSKLIDFTTDLEHKSWAFSIMSESDEWYKNSFNALLNYGLFVPCIKLMVEYMVDDQENLKKELYTISPLLENDASLRPRAKQIMCLLSMHNIQTMSPCHTCFKRKHCICTFCGKNPEIYIASVETVMCSQIAGFTTCERAFYSLHETQMIMFFSVACTCADPIKS